MLARPCTCWNSFLSIRYTASFQNDHTAKFFLIHSFINAYGYIIFGLSKGDMIGKRYRPYVDCITYLVDLVDETKTLNRSTVRSVWRPK